MKTKRALIDLLRECGERLGPTFANSDDAPLVRKIEEALQPPKEMAESETRMRLADIANAVDERLPESHGFITLIFPFGEGEGRRLNYVANCDREDAINTLKEFLLNAGAAEDWMKHIK